MGISQAQPWLTTSQENFIFFIISPTNNKNNKFDLSSHSSGWSEKKFELTFKVCAEKKIQKRFFETRPKSPRMSSLRAFPAFFFSFYFPRPLLVHNLALIKLQFDFSEAA